MSGNTMQELLRGPATISIPEAGRYFHLGRSASYEAARQGVIPTILVGKKRRVVPARRLAAVLGAPDALAE